MQIKPTKELNYNPSIEYNSYGALSRIYEDGMVQSERYCTCDRFGNYVEVIRNRELERRVIAMKKCRRDYERI